MQRVQQAQNTTTKKLLVLGAARSGSTWVSRIICSGCDDVAYRHEPDSHFLYAAAARAKRGLGIYPICSDRLPRSLEELWVSAFCHRAPTTPRLGNVQQKIWNAIPGVWKDYSVRANDSTIRGSVARSSARGAVLPSLREQYSGVVNSSAANAVSFDPPGYILAKSVHAPFYARQLVDAIKPDAVVVTVRPLEELAASWISLNYWPVSRDQQQQTLPILSKRTHLRQTTWPENEIKSIVWSITAMQLELTHAAEESNWILFDHASACENPKMKFKELFEKLQISWSDQVEADLAFTNKTGRSSYDTSRISAEEIGKWKNRLAPEVVEQISTSLREIGTPAD